MRYVICFYEKVVAGGVKEDGGLFWLSLEISELTHSGRRFWRSGASSVFFATWLRLSWVG